MLNRRTFLRITGAALAVPCVVAFENAQPVETIEDLTELAVPQSHLRITGFPSGASITVLDTNTHEVLANLPGVIGDTVEAWVDGDVGRSITVVARKYDYLPCRLDVGYPADAASFALPMYRDEIY